MREQGKQSDYRRGVEYENECDDEDDECLYERFYWKLEGFEPSALVWPPGKFRLRSWRCDGLVISEGELRKNKMIGCVK